MKKPMLIEHRLFLFFKKIVIPKLENQQRPKLFVMTGTILFVFAQQILNENGIKQTLVF